MLFLYSEERNTFINAEQIESICVSSDANIDDAVSIKVYIKGEDAGAGYIMGRGKKKDLEILKQRAERAVMELAETWDGIVRI